MSELHYGKKWENLTQDSTGRTLPEYSQWVTMQYRCSSAPYKLKAQPTYNLCTMDEAWSSYDNYISWARQQIGFNCVDDNGQRWQLDKDLIVAGNKHYGIETCCFVPRSINGFLTVRQNHRGEYPLGVHFVKRTGKFCARVMSGVGDKRTHLGYFNDPEAASVAYGDAKVRLAHNLAVKYSGKIDARAVSALFNFTLERLYEIH